MAKKEWHFPRSAFAASVYGVLVESPASAVSLFGPRRTGKTEFLQQDLAPLAEGRKHRVVYVSLWQTVQAPMASLLYAFDSALRGGSLTDRIKDTARRLAPKFKLKAPGTGAEIEIDVGALRGKPQDNHLLLLDQYCERLADEKHPTILLFDEFQELARSENSAPIVAALRTSLDKRHGSLLSVFTGSSQEGLRKVFSAKDAPFYRFATQMTLPELDEEFIDHQLAVFKSKAKRKIERTDALAVFDKIQRNPLFFQQWLIALMVHSELTPATAIDHVLADIGVQFDFDRIWRGLSGLQRAVLRLLVEQTEQIYAEASTARMASLTGKSAPSNAAVQTAIRRLSRLGMAEKWENTWRLNDTLLEVWVRGRPDTDFKDGR
ncbi:ATP-binding protein [Pseudochelatococcus contaminans]|uniref:ATPase domain-containing protein n=1 Tax=Pseudochelatococcus contaminans TaxID=1538103 RepID=A0A7W5Z660_9HYPH|nr:ATP-binding protein [Pseudochelatococcus contaminans]MBB3810407.1 hypothetical protein [Pseudochelatococcus contaminans]